jgi:hypothetical protein
MLCPTSGRRLVWISQERAPAWAVSMRAQIDGLQAALETAVGELAAVRESLNEARMDIATLRSAPPSKPKVSTVGRPVESRSGGLYGSAIKPATGKARPKGNVLAEERIAAVVASLDAIPLSNKAIARAAGVSNNILYRWSRGGARGLQATAGWLRLEAWIAAQLDGGQGDAEQRAA